MPTTTTHVQTTALETLPPNTLYIALWIRNDPPETNDFHWALYHHHNASIGGKKYDVKGINKNNSHWVTDHAWTGNIFKTNFLCVLIRIADLGHGDGDDGERLDEGIHALDGCVNDIPGVTCRVWLFVVLERLVREGVWGLRDDIGDVDGGGDGLGLLRLEKECMEFGNRVRQEAALNIQPRPVVVSRFCR